MTSHPRTFAQLIDGEVIHTVHYDDYARLHTALEKLAVLPARREERKLGESWIGLADRSCEIARDALNGPADTTAGGRDEHAET